MSCSSVESVLRTSQAYCQQLCDKQTLDHGVAFYSKRFAEVPQANQFREIWIDDPSTVSLAWEEAERWFSDQGVRCLRCAPAGGQPSEELSSFLIEKGFTPRTYSVMVLTEWVEMTPVPSLRVLPARAMRSVFRSLIEQTSDAPDAAVREQIVAANEERLDDPPFDMFVALVDKKPAGYCALYQVGDVTRVIDFNVLDGFADAGVSDGLVAHVLTIARRMAMRNVLAQVPTEDALRRALFERCGFVEDGTLTEFERTSDRSA